MSHFFIDKPSVVERAANNYEMPGELVGPNKSDCLPVILPTHRHSGIDRVPLGRLFEKLKNKRSKYLIGDLMQLSS